RRVLVLGEARLDLVLAVGQRRRVQTREVGLASLERGPERERALLGLEQRLDVPGTERLGLEGGVPCREGEAVKRRHHGERLAGSVTAHLPLAAELRADDAPPALLDRRLSLLPRQREGSGVESRGGGEARADGGGEQTPPAESTHRPLCPARCIRAPAS